MTLVFTLALAAAIMSGCGILEQVTGTKGAPELNKMTSFSAVITVGESEYEADVKRYGTGFWEMTVTKPANIKDMKIDYRDGSVTAALGDLMFDVSSENLNGNAVFALLFNIYDSAATRQGLTIAERDDEMYCAGEFSQGPYELIFDKNGSAITGISAPGLGFSARISRVEEINANEPLIVSE